MKCCLPNPKERHKINSPEHAFVLTLHTEELVLTEKHWWNEQQQPWATNSAFNGKQNDENLKIFSRYHYGVCVCVISYICPATCCPKSHGSSSGYFTKFPRVPFPSDNPPQSHSVALRRPVMVELTFLLRPKTADTTVG